MESKYLKLQEMLMDEEVSKKLLVLTAEECSDVLKKEYGLDFTVDELNEIMRGIQAAAKEIQDGELAESDLEMVSGGAQDKSDYGFGYSCGKAIPAVILLGCVIVASGW